MNPNVMYIENKNKEKWSTGTNLWAVKPVRKSVTLNPWGMYAAGRKRRKMSQEREDLSAAKPVRGRLRGTLGGRYNQTRRKEVQAGTAGGLGSQSGVDGMGPQGLSTGSRWSTTCDLNTVILYVGPMRAINMPPVVGNVEPSYSGVLCMDLQGLSMGRQRSTT